MQRSTKARQSLWQASIELPKNQEIEYKYVTIDTSKRLDEATWERLPDESNRRVDTTNKQSISLREKLDNPEPLKESTVLDHNDMFGHPQGGFNSHFPYSSNDLHLFQQ